MGFWSRLKVIFGAKASSALDRAEDPRQVMDYAYNQQRELLVKLRRGLLDVATSKQQLEQQAEKLKARVPQLEDQARRALAAGREDLARIALERKAGALGEMQGLTTQIAEVATEEERMTKQERSLAIRIEEFRTHRDIVSARFGAADAEVKVKEALSGVSGELAELGMAVGRAEEKTERLQARARALDSLVDVGALPPAGGGDYVEAELLRLTSGAEIDEELARLRSEMVLPRLAAGKEGSE
jgi:phage shock protein A